MSSYVNKPIPAECPPVAHVKRPWGEFKQYANNQEVTVSLMTVNPGHQLSLQAHTGRAELWIVLDNGAIIQLDDKVIRAMPGDEIWIPANTQHRLTSIGRQVRVLEVAFGNWQQADITRLADNYNRPEQGEIE